jgi:hypothetical protein
MRRLLLSIVLVTAPVCLVASTDDAEDRAVAEIVRAQGRVRTDSKTPGEPVDSVDLVNATDSLMEQLGTLTSVRVVSVHSNRNSVTSAGWSHLAKLAQLESLYLGLAAFKIRDADLERMSGLTRLETLDLTGQKSITGAGLAGLKKLASLTLWATSVNDDGLSSLRELSQLTDLNLRSTGITDAALKHVEGLSSLRGLTLADTKVGDAGVAHLRGLTRLERLSLRDTRVTDAGLAHLEGLTALDSLVLNDTAVTDAGLVHLRGLTRLRNLSLDSTRVTGEGLNQLKDLKDLRQLTLYKTPVNAADVESLKKALPNLQVFQ